MATDRFDATVTVRVFEEKIKQFKEHCANVLHRDHSDVLRELIDALPENRLTLTEAPEKIAARDNLYKS